MGPDLSWQAAWIITHDETAIDDRRILFGATVLRRWVVAAGFG
jgi:hypothetical protein